MAHRNSHKSTIKNVIVSKMWNMYTDFSNNMLIFVSFSIASYNSRNAQVMLCRETTTENGLKKRKHWYLIHTLSDISKGNVVNRVSFNWLEGYLKLRLQTLFCQSNELNAPDLNILSFISFCSLLWSISYCSPHVTCVFLLQRQ